MDAITVTKLKENTNDSPQPFAVEVELQSRSERQTKTGKPYLVLTFADATGGFNLNAWSDSPLYKTANTLEDGSVMRIEASWTQNQFGLDAAKPRITTLTGDALEAFYAGDAETTQRQQAAWETIQDACTRLQDPRLNTLARHFIDHHGDRLKRAAAARRNHHARRGGLIEHIAQMMRSAEAICGVYPQLNRDLILTAVLFHDSGKLWENQYPEQGFAQRHSIYGELLGHIPLGIELANKLWHDVMALPAAKDWLTEDPPNEHVRLHLLHLIASHHGELAFGSPTLPRTPEAFALHYIDNLDAKLEMIHDAYRDSTELAPGIYEKRFPLPSNLVEPLPAYETTPTPNPQGNAADNTTTPENPPPAQDQLL